MSDNLPSLRDRMDYSRALSQSDLLPPAYRAKPANVLLAVEHGTALGIPPMTAIQGIHVIQGKPTLSADLMAALVRRAGHKLRVTTAAEPSATATLIRADDPEFTYTATWDMGRARDAQLTNKDTWKQHPLAMLKARAISEVIREGASEVLHGLIYTPEEIGGEAHPDDVTTGEEAAVEAPAGVDAETGEIVDAELVEDGPGEPEKPGEPEPEAEKPAGTVTKQQLTKLAILTKELGLGDDRDAYLSYLSGVVERDVESSKALSKAEASRVIDAMSKLAAAADPADPEPSGEQEGDA